MGKTVTTLQGLKMVTATAMGFLILAGQWGCVASRIEVSRVENRTVEIEQELHRLQSELNKRLKVLERLDGRYDFSNSMVASKNPLYRVIDSIVTIETETVFETYRTSERVVRVSKGIGVVAGAYVLTLNHVVTQDDLLMESPLGPITFPAQKIGETRHLVSQDERLILREILRNPELDIALFEMPENTLNLPSLPCPVGNSDELTVGTFLYIVGNPFNSGINMREGIVSSLKGLDGVDMPSTTRDDLFVISNGVVPGDSGAPVFGLRDGVPELVGLVQGTLGPTRIGWVTTGVFCVAERPSSSSS
jgi:S1-C subfamily serine protease